MSNFSGIWVALVTPFQDGRVDFAALKRVVAHVVEGGVTGLVVCGSTGEAAALDETEHLAVLDAVIAAAGPECRVVMGLSGNNLQAVRSRMQQIEQRPVAGLLITPPYYIRPSQQGIVDYFTSLADASSVDIILYNIPYRTGVGMDLETIRTLAQHPRVTAIKDCGGDPLLSMQLIADAELQVLAGEDTQIFTTVCLGGAGAISAAAQLRPDLFVRMADALAAGRLEQGRELFQRMLPMMRQLLLEPNPAQVKAGLSTMGLADNELRAPLRVAAAGHAQNLGRELERLPCKQNLPRVISAEKHLRPAQRS